MKKRIFRVYFKEMFLQIFTLNKNCRTFITQFSLKEHFYAIREKKHFYKNAFLFYNILEVLNLQRKLCNGYIFEKSNRSKKF